MRKLLIKLFIKNYKDTTNQEVRTKYGTLSGIVGICTNLLICIVKIIIGIISASLSILADGINNLSDAGTSIVTLLGFKIANKKPDEKHPFGYQRFEYLGGIIVSIVILIVGGTLLFDSITKIFSPEEITTNWIIIIILGVSILAKLWQANFYYQMGKTIDSLSLKANATDSLVDCISTLTVLIGSIIIHFTNLYIIDSIFGIGVAIFILISGIKLLKETISPLLGIDPSPEDIEKITTKIFSYPGVLGIHDLIIHNYGYNKNFVIVHVEVDRYVDIMKSHDMIDNIEHDFKKDLNIDLVIHMDPIDTKDENTIRLKELVNNVINSYDPVLNFHDFRAVTGITHTNVIFDLVMPIKYPLSANELKEVIARKINEADNSVFAVISVDQKYERNL